MVYMNNVTTIYSEDSTPCDTEPRIKDVLPQIYIDLDFDHFSPSQLKQPFHYWLTNYFLLDAEIKKKKKASPMARAGSAVHQLFQDIDIKKLPFKSVMEDVLNDFRKRRDKYDTKDLFKADEYEKRFMPTYNNVQFAFKELGVIECDLETPINLELPELDIPITGYTDFRTRENVIELKTKWNRIREVNDQYNVFRILKNGMWSKTKRVFKTKAEVDVYVNEQDCECKVMFEEKHFQCDSAPNILQPFPNDIMQLALYCRATKKKPIIVYATEKDFKIFSQDNCDLLSQESLDEYVEKARRIALSRQNLLKKVNDPFILTQLIEPPDLNEFWYDLGDEVENEVKRVWNL